MILEVAILNVKAGRTTQFEADFKLASQYISAIDGYIDHSLQKCIENAHQYILLVHWETLESHTIGFRKSEEYLEWKRLLHDYYEPFPMVEHYEMVFQNKK